jgi:hypothetical protein
VNIQFHHKASVLQVSLYVDFRADESYTPKRLSIRAGTTTHDLRCAVDVRVSSSRVVNTSVVMVVVVVVVMMMRGCEWSGVLCCAVLCCAVVMMMCDCGCGVLRCAAVCYGVLWCAVVCCGVLWCACAVVCCGVLWCAVVSCGVVWCRVVWCCVVWACMHVWVAAQGCPCCYSRRAGGVGEHLRCEPRRTRRESV